VPLAKAAVRAYCHDQDISHSYYAGCSTGGRQGLRQIEVDGGSFDGVVIGAPAWDTVGLRSFGAYLMNEHVKARGGQLTAANVGLARTAVEQVCGRLGQLVQTEACRKSFVNAPAQWGQNLDAGTKALLTTLISNLTDPRDGSSILYNNFDVNAVDLFNLPVNPPLSGIHTAFARMIGNNVNYVPDALHNSKYDVLEAMVAWTERNQAPTNLTAVKFNSWSSGNVVAGATTVINEGVR
jgi:hypothetical protein